MKKLIVALSLFVWLSTSASFAFALTGSLGVKAPKLNADIQKEIDKTNVEVCVTMRGYFWDLETKTCLAGEEYCKGRGLEYDSGINGCVAPESGQGTLIPETTKTESVCEALFRYDSANLGKLKGFMSQSTNETQEMSELSVGDEKFTRLDVLGCAIKTGRIGLWMVPYFIKYLIQFALTVAGLVAIGSIVIGGYFYLFGGVMDDKDKGKRAILYGALGFVVAILAWAIVNIVIALATR